jgi:hypothetical protein
VLLALGCRDKEAAKQPPPSPVSEVGPGTVTLALGTAEEKLTWGVATYRPAGLEIRLGSEHLACADLDNTALPSGSAASPGQARLVDARERRGTQLAFSVPPGPEGKFYVHAPIGVSAVLSRPGKQTPIPTDETTLTLDPFTPLVAGAHVKGKLVAATHVDDTNLIANGTFDVEVCKEPPSPVRALRAEAPTTPVAGTFEAAKLEPKTVHAIVKTRPQRGPYVAQIVFYDKADVPCGATDGVLFTVKEFATRKTPTPAEVVLVRRDPAAEINFDAWVTFENAAFEAGEHVKGSLWAQPAFQWEGKGELGGTFDAAVCVL